jgi:DNA polymerase
MQVISFDFETYYADDYTLSKMTNESYIRDPRFEAQCAGVCIKATATTMETRFSLSQDELRPFIESLNWSKVIMVSHHAHFDGLILKHHYGVQPAMYIDTLSMARAMLPKGASLSLDSLSKRFNLPPKSVPYMQVKNKRWCDMPPDLQRLHMQGGQDDAYITLLLADKLKAMGFPAEEMITIDWTVKAYTDPQLIGNAKHFWSIAESEQERKQAMLDNLGITKADLSSNDKFAAILEALGVDVDKKANAKGDFIPAVAKSDSFMKELLSDDNPDELVKTLAEARVAVKSTTRETRAGRLAAMSERGALCFYYYYCGAKNTNRWSGGDKINPQNFERKGPIRGGICAPEGYKIYTIDQSQIECRVLNTWAGQLDVVERFANGEDIYILNASLLYGREVTKENPAERGTGKQIELSCGYGCGAAKFQQTAALGIYGPPVKIDLREAKAAVDFYRNGHPHVVDLWRLFDSILLEWRQYGVKGTRYEIGPVTIIDGISHLPNGLALDYSTVEYDEVLGEYFFHHKRSFARNVPSEPPMGKAERWEWWYRRGYRGIYGAKMVEQHTQALARVSYSQACIRVYKQLGLRPAITSHDEAGYVIPNEHVELYKPLIHRLFIIPPKWMPNLPVAAEYTIGDTYSK